MASLIPFQPAPADYPNHLALPEPERIAISPARWLLLGLLVLCLLPRCVMAVRIPGVCPDGVLYIHLAKAIEAGDLQTGFREMSLNIYPLILVLLHRVGLDWELAATMWGVGISSLVVLPLYGWLRRQFDDRVALVACLLYAVHPRFIAESAEIMRDPTFWFLFVLSLYWLWRATTEVHLGYFTASGAAIILASLTRVEGLFLLVPLALWTFWRWLALRTRRGKLLFGATLCVAAVPLLLALANFVWLYEHSGWTWIRVDPLTRVRPWLEHVVSHEETAVTADSLAPPMHIGRMVWVYFPTMTRGLTPIFALLMFGGMWGWRWVWLRRDHQALFYTALVSLVGIWVQLWYDRNISPRYALPIALMAAPFAALGLLGLVSRLERFARWLCWGHRGQTALVSTALALIFAAPLLEGATSSARYFQARRTAASIGCWVHRAFPVSPMIIGPAGDAPIIGYYAQTDRYKAFRWDATDASIIRLVEESGADVVVLRPIKDLKVERCKTLLERLGQLGMTPVSASTLPATSEDYSIAVRAGDLDLTQKPVRQW